MVTSPDPQPATAGTYRPRVLGPVDEQFEPRGPVAGWMDAALCAQIGPEPFYAEVHGHGSGRDYAERDRMVATAKATCGRCPVQAECLAHALANDERYGIWGGVDMEARA